MAKLHLRRIITVPLIYFLLIVGIFVLQFTQGKAFTYTNGALSVSGSYIQEEDGSQSLGLPLHLVYKGLDMYIEDSSPVQLVVNQNKKNVVLEDLENLENGFKLDFSENSSISFTSQKRGDVDVLSISAQIPFNANALMMSYKIINSAKQEKKDSMLLVSSDSQQFVFSGLVNSDEKLLTFTASSPSIGYRTYVPAKGVEIANLVNLPMASQEIYTASVEKYASTSLATIRSALNNTYSEEDVSVFVSEMARNGMYRTGISTVPVAFTVGNSRTYLTNTFFGSLVKTYESLLLKERDDLAKVSRLISENNPEMFEFKNLIPFLLDRTTTPLFDDVIKLAPEIQMSNVSPLQAAGIIEAIMDTDKYRPDISNPFVLLEESSLRIISESLKEVGDSLYISSDDKKVNTLECIRIGNLLVEYGNKNSKPQWAAVGRILVSSIMSYMNDRGNLPGTLNFTYASDGTTKAGLIPDPSKILKPSEVYPFLVKNDFYPHEECLFKTVGSGAWAWTSAQTITVKKPTEQEISFIVKFPVGESHYLVMRGIKPFTRIQIYGIDYRTDPRFESYNSSGYVYNAKTQTLYLKMRHKTEYETIKLFYDVEGTNTSSTEEVKVIEQPSETVISNDLVETEENM